MIVSSTSIAGYRFIAPLLTVCLIAFLFGAKAQTIRYVKQGGTGNGSSWATAAGDIQAIINASAVGDEIWVAEGTYLPTRPADNLGVVAVNNRNNAFTFIKDLKIYGGFPATGNPNMTDRDWEANPTVLSGNLGNPAVETDNAYHVVITAGNTVTADFFMDGFTITGGYGDGTTAITVNGETPDQLEGAGWHNVAGSPTVSHVSVTGNTVTGSGNGGGWYNNLNAQPTITHSVIRGNQAGRYGGGMHNGNSSGVTMDDVVISDNSAEEGGGLNVDGGVSRLTRVVITGNTTTFGDGGGIRNIGLGELVLTDALIAGNRSAQRGGGLYNLNKVTLTNVTLSGNTASEGGALGIELGPMGPGTELQNCIIWGNSSGIYNPNTASISYSLLQDGTGDPTNIIGADPLFNDAPSHSSAPFTLGDYRLQAGSPAIDAGNNALYTGSLATDKDLMGNPRLTGSVIDMGAYEFQPTPEITPGTGNILYVNRNVSNGNGSGDSWANALPELRDALQWARDNAANWSTATPLQIWVAAGEYQPVANESFQMVDHVRIYGGFAGTESTLSLRNWNTNRTTLRGNGNSVVRNPEGLALSRSARLDGFTITGGQVAEGGGIYSRADATFANLVITGNTATGSGGGVRNFASSLYYNILITGNTSPLGAGFFNTIEASSPVLVNVTSSGNEGDTGAELHLEAGNPIIRNSIFHGNGVFFDYYRQYDVKNSIIQNLTVNSDGSIPGTTNPLFTDAANGDFSLSPASAAINAGSNQVYADYIGVLAGQLDLTGAARAQQGTIDMGALESPGKRILVPTETGNILYVNQEVDQQAVGYTGDGSSWANAIPDLWSALIWVRENADNWTMADPLQIWVAGGEYRPAQDQSFEMVNHVKIYGGFEGTETTLAARSLAMYGTVLYSNGNSVVRNPEGLVLSRSAVLDGFAIGDFFLADMEAEAPEGAGIFNSGDATFANLFILSNIAETAGGGIYNTGSALFYNVLIAGNTAPKGAGFYNASASSAPVLVNVTIMGSAENVGQAFYLEAGNPVIRNSILYGNEVFGITDATDIEYSLVEGRMATDNGNIADVGFPLFEYASIEAMMFPTSPTINTGSNQAYIDLVGPFDDQIGFFGLPRLQQGVIDMGAIETPFKKALKPDENNIVYINKNVDQTSAAYAADGSSWDNAVPELADALLWARVKRQLDIFFPELATGDPLKIYVANGTYLPLYGAEDDDFMLVDGGRDNAFVMVPNTMLYGGFDPENGITALTHQRILPGTGGGSLPAGSILSGNLGDVNSQSDNAYRVVIAANTTGDESFLVDGFAITGAVGDSDGTIWVNEQEIPQGKGGGWYNVIGNPIMERAQISSNTASVNRTVHGADWLNKFGKYPALTELIADASRAKPTNMTTSTTKANRVNVMASEGPSPTLTNVVISGNTAQDGGGMYSSMSSPTLTNVIISGNTATAHGGAMYNDQSSPTLTNVTISGNAAPNGGAIAGLGLTDLPTAIRNSIIWGNSSGILYSEGLLNISHSIVQGGQPGEGNLDINPLFIDAPSHEGAPFTGGNYRLQTGSPAINVGNNAVFELGQTPDLSAINTDLAGNPRIARSKVDMGVFESPYAAITALGAIQSITVPYGTALNAVPVPDPFTVEATLNGGTTEPIALAQDLAQWTVAIPASGIYDGHIAGTYSFEMEIADDDANLNPRHLRATVDVIVEKGSPVITWERPETISYGTALGADQLNASADVAGTFTYEPAAETVLTVGDHTLEVTFTPDDDANYTTATAEVTLTVGKATPIIDWATPTAITYGAALGADQLNASAEVAGTFTYGPAFETVLTAGDHTLNVTFTPDDDANYTTATAEMTLTVGKATPLINWASPAAITYGTMLGDDQLNASADVAGMFTYDPAVETVLTAGDHTLNATFTPEDGINYTTAVAEVVLTVNKALAIITTDALQTYIYDGTVKNAVASLNHGETTLIYGPQWGYADAGTYRITITAAETANYQAADMEIALEIKKAGWTGTPVTFPNIDPIAYDGEEHEIIANDIPPGSEVDYIIIDGEGNEIPGNAIADAGDYTVIVVIRQDNFEDITIRTPVTITKAQAIITADATQTHSYDGAVKDILANLNHGETTLSYNPQRGYAGAGSYPITVSATETANYRAASMELSLEIKKAGWTGTPVTFPNIDPIAYDGEEHEITANDIPPGSEVDYIIIDGDGNEIPGNAITDAGDYTVIVVIRQDNYDDITVSTPVTIAKAQAVITGDALQTRVYDGTVQNIAVNLNHSETVLRYSPQQGYVNAGRYPIIVAAGETTNYLGAAARTVTLLIERAVWDGPAIVLPNAPEFTYNGNPHPVVAENLPPGATVDYTVTDANGNTVPSNEVTETGEYTVTVTVKQDNYRDVVVSTTVTVRPAARTLNFAVLPEKTYGDADFLPEATASTGETVSYISDNLAVASIINGRIHIVGAGTANITATVAKNADYTTRPSATQTLVVRKAPQTISFDAPAEVDREAGSISLDASSSGGLPITLSLDDPEVATLEGTTLHIHRLGTARITATQLGDANHEAAEPVTVTVRVVDPTAELPMRVSKVVSPNGDGINEFLLIEGIKDHPENKVTVFNRNGTILYEAEGYDNGRIAFRGISTGQLPLPAGTYFYVAEIKVAGTWKHEKGWFVLRY